MSIEIYIEYFSFFTSFSYLMQNEKCKRGGDSSTTYPEQENDDGIKPVLSKTKEEGEYYKYPLPIPFLSLIVISLENTLTKILRKRQKYMET